MGEKFNKKILVMSGPLSKQEAQERMKTLLSNIEQEGEAKHSEILNDARALRDDKKKRNVEQLKKEIDHKFEKELNKMETATKTKKSNFILDARKICQEDRNVKLTGIIDSVKAKLEKDFAANPETYRVFVKN